MKSLLFASLSTALLCGPVLAASKSDEPVAAAHVAKVLRIPGMDKAPVPVNAVCPVYPYELRREGVQGVVTVDLRVDSTGRVVATDLVSSNAPELNALALEAASKWTFVPASAKGQPITTRVRVPFEFVMPQLVASRR